MESKKKITDAAIKRWLHKNGQKKTAYKFDFLSIATRANVRAWVKTAIRAELAKEA